MIILVEIKVKGFPWKCLKSLPYMVKIIEHNNCQLVKDIGHFKQKKNSQVEFKN